MKIVNAIELAKLPEGILYSEWTPCILGDLMVKGETLSDTHWFDANLNTMKEMFDMERDLKPGDTSPLEISYSRAVHNPEELFGVWELKDLKELSEVINEGIGVMESLE